MAVKIKSNFKPGYDTSIKSADSHHPRHHCFNMRIARKSHLNTGGSNHRLNECNATKSKASLQAEPQSREPPLKTGSKPTVPKKRPWKSELKERKRNKSRREKKEEEENELARLPA